MSRARLALLVVVLSLPGCLVVTCGSTDTIGRDGAEATPEAASEAEPLPAPDTASGAGATW